MHPCRVPCYLLPCMSCVRKQVGATPEGTEKPRCLRDAKLRELAAGMAPENAPTIPTGADVKVGGRAGILCGRAASIVG